MNTTKYSKINLKPLKERSVVNFHPWIFSGAIKTNVDGFEEGEIVEVYDASDKYLATGHFHHGTIMVRIITFSKKEINHSFWNEKFLAAYQLRRMLNLAGSSATNAFRLIHGEGDGLPGLVIDIYNKAAVIQCHSEGMILSVNEIAEALKQIKELGIETIYNKSAESSLKQKGSVVENGLIFGSAIDDVVKENNLQFYVNWKEGQKTGFFLDQRDNRNLLSQFASGKSVLNTFSYSGGFSVYALKGGATNVDSVDSSVKAGEWTEKNIALNSFSNSKHTFHNADVFDYLKSNHNKYDIIVLDPPAFAKHLSAIDRAVIGYRNLNSEAITRIKPGGIIFTFSCSQAIDKQLFRKTVFTAAAKTGRNVRVLHQLTQGPDHPVSLYHPEGEYLKGLVLVVD